jgi:hypothetical protein
MIQSSVSSLSMKDLLCGIVGALSCLIGLSLALSPRLPGYGPFRQIAAIVLCAAVAVACVLISRSRVAVGLGMLLIVVSRILIGGFFYLEGAYRR